VVGLGILEVFLFNNMASTQFPNNPVLNGMSYKDEILIIHFKKQSRTYASVPINIGYGLFYSKKPVTYFNENIKKKFKVIDVK
jgi:hypothetical protein